MSYLLIETLHLLFVIAWMAAVIYLPQILVNLAETTGEPAVQVRLQLMGRRLYKFGHNMFGLAFLCGVVLWQGWRVLPRVLPDTVGSMHWIDAKLTLVAVLLAYYIACGRLLKRASTAGAVLPSPQTLRGYSKLSLLLLLGVIFLVLVKPF